MSPVLEHAVALNSLISFVFSLHGQFEFGTWIAAGRAMDPSMRPEPVPMRAARRFERWV